MEQQNQDPSHNSGQSPSHILRENHSQNTGEDRNGTSSIPERYTEDPDYYKNFLDQLLSLVCNRDQATVSRMVSIIRSGASHLEILAAMSQMQVENNHTGQDGHAGVYDQNKDDR
ncbi:hypothetical protein EYZ11_000978 [Aspergillus tanneri]|uniref:Uncharacterized protein n=1 Tax=Aspergillus tanneri TaxID=1220188 RepID=A0A4S3JVP8_9EURO|nr:uncharacterized protein ATNIH1004_002639 [Aspergillus tanneri]KAA8649959.1 hypothetical protein ATNIH1004_002639 [Aspergillus tanneri]THC99518.1 hypothetical protein EYZ11_000978 [Aspergillus tanneri]